jgi:UDP-glucose 4-epimerase
MNQLDYLVFGSNGFLGSHILQQINTSPHSSLGVSRGGKDKEILEGEVYSNYSQEDLDLLLSHTKPKKILISIGISSINQAELHPDSRKEVESALLNIIKAVKKSSSESTVFLVSSAAVYGNSSNQALSEDDKLSPTSFYGEQKVIVERMFQKFAQINDLNLSIIRIFSVYGPKQKRHVVWDVFSQAKKQNEVVLAGSGKEIRDFIFVEELAKQIFELTLVKKHLPDVINLGTGHHVSICELSKKIITICDLTTKIFFSQRIDYKNPFSLYPDITRARNLGIVNSNAASLEVGLKITTSKWNNHEDFINS